MSLLGSFNGLAFGPGQKIHVAGIQGFDDLPAVRSSDEARVQDHGSYRGLDFLDARQIILTLAIIGDDNADYTNLLAQLETAFQSTPAELPLLLMGNTRRLLCRVRHRAIPYDAAQFQRTGTATIDLLATDPRIYDATLQQPSSGLPAVSGGMGFSVGFPLGFGAAGTGGILTVTNAGNAPTRPVATIAGPVTNPSIQNQTAGLTWQCNIVLGATDVLTVDFDARTIILNGTASRRNLMPATSQWWELAPGISTIRYFGSTYDPASLMTLAFRSAWL